MSTLPDNLTIRKNNILFIDTEFNGFRSGILLSMAIVTLDESDWFYEVIQPPCDTIIDEWVMVNVCPNFAKDKIPYRVFQNKLYDFLYQYKDGFTLIADWPEDLHHFCKAIILGPGKMPLPSFEMHYERDITSIKSENPHNALCDVIAIRDSWKELYGN